MGTIRFKRYNRFGDMPNTLLAFLASAGFLVSAGTAYIVASVAPDALRVANETPLAHWGWQGWFLLTCLACLTLMSWFHGALASRASGLLKQRLFD